MSPTEQLLHDVQRKIGGAIFALTLSPLRDAKDSAVALLREADAMIDGFDELEDEDDPISNAMLKGADQAWEQADARAEAIAREFERAGDQRVASRLRGWWARATPSGEGEGT